MKIKENDSYFKYFVCAGLAGAISSVPTCPFDVIKTKLNTQSCYNNTCQKKVVCNMLKTGKKDYAVAASKIKIDAFEPFQPRLSMGICSEKPV